MAVDIDCNEYLGSLEQAARLKDQAVRLGSDLAKEGVRRVFLVACGAPNRAMGAIKYFMDRDIQFTEFYLYYPAEFIRLAPKKLDQNSLVVLASHSGATPEVLETAEFVKPYGAKVVALTQFEDSRLAQAVPNTLVYGKSELGYFATYLLLTALLSGLVKEAENWELADKVIQSLDALPQVLLDAALYYEPRATAEARQYHEADNFMLLGAGPCHSTAYVAGVCIMMEMLWRNVFTGEAAEFFHGPFEMVLPDVPVIVYMGEDDSRPVAERVVKFCQRFTENLIVYDSQEFEMKGVAPEVRPMFAPFVLQAATRRFMEHLAVWHNHPLSTRRYMGKMEY